MTPDIYDTYADQVGVVELQLRGFGKRRSFHGPCSTIKCFEDHRLVRAASQSPGGGRVLVVDAGGSMRVAMMGDMLASNCMNNGWAGVVIFGVVRDTPQIDALDFGVKALGTTARRSGPEDLGGSVDLPVSFGGVTFRPGDWVYADADAVLVSPSELAL